MILNVATVTFVSLFFLIVNTKKILKMAESKKVLVVGFHIVWATDHCISKDTQSIFFGFSYKFVISKGLLSFVSTRTFWLLVLLLPSQTHDLAYNYGQGR